MANNCSHTKYQVETQNENLLKLGEFTINTASNFRLSGPSNLGIKIRTIDGTITYNGTSSKEATIIDGNFAVLQAGAKYFIQAPYSLGYFNMFVDNKGSEVDYDALLFYRKYSIRLVLQELNNEYGSYDIAKCAESLSTIPGELTLSYLYDLSGNISAFSVLSANYININGTLISGDIADMLNGYSKRGINTVQVVPNGIITFSQTVLQNGKVYTFTYSGGEWSYTVA